MPSGNDAYTKLLLHFDGDFSDSAIGNVAEHTWSGTGVISDSASKFGDYSLYLNGSKNIYTSMYPSYADYVIGTSFTLDCWINLSTTGGLLPIMYNGQDGNDGWMFYYQNGVGLGLYSTDNSGNGLLIDLQQGSSSGYSTGTWYHVAFVKSGNDFYLFKDGVVVASTHSVTYIKNVTGVGQLLQIGYCYWNAEANYFNGYIDELRISNGIARWTSTFTPSTEPYGEEPPTVTNSFGAGGNDLNTVLLLHGDGSNNAASESDSSLGRTEPHSISFYGNACKKTAYKKFGTASLYFDGTGDYITVPDSADWNFTGDFTIDFWMYVVSLTAGTDMGIIEQSEISSGYGYTPFTIMIKDGTTLAFEFSTTGTSWALTVGESASSFTVTTGTWHHIALSRSGNNFYGFANGELVWTYTGSLTLWDAARPLLIGSRANIVNKYFNGYLDEIRISKGVARWTEEFTPPAQQYDLSPPVRAIDGGNDEYTVLLLHAEDNSDSSIGKTEPHIITNSGVGISSTKKFGGGSFLFNSASDIIRIPSSKDFYFAGVDFTIDFWFMLTSLPGASAIMEIYMQRDSDASAAPYTSIAIGGASYASKGLTFMGYDTSGSTGWDINEKAVNYNVSQWYHGAAVRKGRTLMLFKDGVMIGKATLGAGLEMRNHGGNVCIGNDAYLLNSTTAFTGQIDELRVSKGIARWTDNFLVPDAPYGSFGKRKFIVPQSTLVGLDTVEKYYPADNWK
jgi:hypothetical protein